MLLLALCTNLYTSLETSLTTVCREVVSDEPFRDGKNKTSHQNYSSWASQLLFLQDLQPLLSLLTSYLQSNLQYSPITVCPAGRPAAQFLDSCSK
jgi:hypothetical protein